MSIVYQFKKDAAGISFNRLPAGELFIFDEKLYLKVLVPGQEKEDQPLNSILIADSYERNLVGFYRFAFFKGTRIVVWVKAVDTLLIEEVDVRKLKDDEESEND